MLDGSLTFDTVSFTNNSFGTTSIVNSTFHQKRRTALEACTAIRPGLDP
jgi:hypothetical protein